MSGPHAPALPPAEALRFRARGIARPALLGGAGALLLAVAAVLGRGAPGRWLTGYLVAFLFAVTIALGGLFFAPMLHTSRAAWGVVLRRPAEALAATLPLFALLFVPLALGAGHLYSWMDPGHAHGLHGALLEHKAPYLNPAFFFLRAALILLVWGVSGWWCWRRSTDQDSGGDALAARRLRRGSHLALVAFAVSLTIASFDWMMSLTPTWYSTMYPVIVFAGVAISSLAVVSLLTLALERRGGLAGLVTAEHYHDLGKLLFSFVVFWGYVGFSQYLLMWYANIPEETAWYAARLTAQWRPLTMLLAVSHFVLPFFFLIGRVAKRRRGLLLAGSVWMLGVHLLDLIWLVVPSVPGGGAEGWWLPVTVCVPGVVLLTAALMIFILERAPTVAGGDPRLAESLVTESG